jgi:hypothetical protein
MESESVTPVSVQADLRVSADAASNGTGAVPMSGGSAPAPRISGPELAVAASRPSAAAADRQPAEASTARLDLGRAERVEMLPPAVAPPFDLEVTSQA